MGSLLGSVNMVAYRVVIIDVEDFSNCEGSVKGSKPIEGMKVQYNELNGRSYVSLLGL